MHLIDFTAVHDYFLLMEYLNSSIKQISMTCLQMKEFNTQIIITYNYQSIQ